MQLAVLTSGVAAVESMACRAAATSVMCAATAASKSGVAAVESMVCAAAAALTLDAAASDMKIGSFSLNDEI